MYKEIQKIFRNILQIVSGLLGVFVLLTLFFTKLDEEASVFDLTNRQFISDYVSNIILGIVICALIFIWFAKICKTPQNIKRENFYRVLACATFVLFCAQIFLVYHTYFVAGNDVLNIRTGAINFVKGIYDDFYNMGYFQMCPNNIMAYMIYILAYAFGEVIGINGNYILIGCSICLANTAVLFATLSTLKLTNNYKAAWLVYILSVAMFGLSPWIGIPYTDMLSIAAPIVTFYVYLTLRDKPISSVVKWICIMIIPVITYGIKPLNIIIFIAILICEMLFLDTTQIVIREILGCITAVLLVGVIYVGLNTLIENHVGYLEDRDKSFGLTWVLLLGSDDGTYGMWSFENYDFAMQYDTQEERQEAMLGKVFERISNMGVKGYISHWMNKIHIFFNDAHFGWTTALHYVAELPERSSDISEYMRNIFYPPEEYSFSSNYPGYGEYFKEYSIVKQAIWLCVVIFMVVGFCYPTNDKRIVILKTTWIGVFLFSMLFETHARILISYLPMFCLMAGVGAAKGTQNEKKDE